MKKLLLALVILVLPLIANAATAIELHSFRRGSWNDILKAHAGQPLIVHFWGVTCGPCRIEMPEWGRLLRERPDLKLVVINADLVPNAPAVATTMLKETGLADAENWIFEDRFVERLRYEVDRQWRGEIPRTMLIACEGTITTIEGSADMEEVRDWLDKQNAAAR
jgi:thiol-disulfide isomerase/thioredoxin